MTETIIGFCVMLSLVGIFFYVANKIAPLPQKRSNDDIYRF